MDCMLHLPPCSGQYILYASYCIILTTSSLHPSSYLPPHIHILPSSCPLATPLYLHNTIYFSHTCLLLCTYPSHIHTHLLFFSGEALPDIGALDLTYRPQMGEVTSLALPSNLPLDFLADIQYDGMALPSIAPSSHR